MRRPAVLKASAPPPEGGTTVSALEATMARRLAKHGQVVVLSTRGAR
jgi:hypothetical protein